MAIPGRGLAQCWPQCQRGRGGGDGLGNNFSSKFSSPNPEKNSAHHMDETYPFIVLEGRRGENPIMQWLAHLLEVQVSQGEVSAAAD